jgi:integrase
MRDKLVVSIIYHTKARPTDICRLQMSDVGINSKTIKVKNKRYPVPGEVITGLIEYSTFNKSKVGPVFRNFKGAPLSPAYVLQIVSDAFLPRLNSTTQIISMLKDFKEKNASPNEYVLTHVRRVTPVMLRRAK